MINYFLFIIINTFLTFLEQISERIKNGLLLSFSFIFIFIAIRYDYGYDYLMYEEEFKIINSLNHKFWPPGMLRLEYGWIYLNKFFGSLGFNYLIIFLSLFYCLVLYLFIKTMLDRKLHVISVLLLLLSPGIFILHQSLLRQCVALLFFLVAVLLVEKKQPLLYSCIVLITASFFHTSALLLLPLLFTQYIRLNTIHLCLIPILYLVIFFIGYNDYFYSSVAHTVALTFPKYAIYLQPSINNEVQLNTGLGVVFAFANLLVILYFKNEFFHTPSLRIIFFSVICSYLISPFSLIFSEFFRLNIYFEFFFIIVIPLIYSFISNRKLKYLYLCLNIIFSVYTLTSFFKNDKDEQKFNTYKTIFK